MYYILLYISNDCIDCMHLPYTVANIKYLFGKFRIYKLISFLNHLRAKTSVESATEVKYRIYIHVLYRIRLFLYTHKRQINLNIYLNCIQWENNSSKMSGKNNKTFFVILVGD